MTPLIPARHSLTFRLLSAQLFVVLISLLSAMIVAALVGPAIFNSHLDLSGTIDPRQTDFHIQQAYKDANYIALAAAIPTAIVSSIGVSFWLSHRLGQPLWQLSRAATSMSAGNYHVRVPLDNADKEVAAVSLAFNSMADQLEHTEELRRNMLSDLSHEMNTPLSVLLVYLDGLHDGMVEWDEETQEVFSEQLARLSRLTSDLDDVSRAQEHRFELHYSAESLGQLIHQAAGAAAGSFQEKGVELEVSGSNSTQLLWVDRQRFAQVLANLLSNALRHTPPSGKVEVRALRLGISTAVIEVRDNGEGIAQENLKYVFERYFRVKRSDSDSQSGSGIGLTISKALIEAQGGTLTVDSPGLGKGATFTIRIPLHTAAPKD